MATIILQKKLNNWRDSSINSFIKKGFILYSPKIKKTHELLKQPVTLSILGIYATMISSLGGLYYESHNDKKNNIEISIQSKQDDNMNITVVKPLMENKIQVPELFKENITKQNNIIQQNNVVLKQDEKIDLNIFPEFDERELNLKVMKAILKASEKTGFDKALLMSFAWFESKMDNNVKNDQSSAVGLFQFTNSSWLEAMKKYGNEIGLNHYSEAITISKKGNYVTQNYKVMKDILKLRLNPEISAFMAAKTIQDAKSNLENKIGYPLKNNDIYLIHVLGGSGTEKVLNALQKSPSISSEKIIPKAVKNNHHLFYTDDNHVRSIKSAKKFISEMVKERLDRYNIFLSKGDNYFLNKLHETKQEIKNKNVNVAYLK